MANNPFRFDDVEDDTTPTEKSVSLNSSLTNPFLLDDDDNNKGATENDIAAGSGLERLSSVNDWLQLANTLENDDTKRRSIDADSPDRLRSASMGDAVSEFRTSIDMTYAATRVDDDDDDDDDDDGDDDDVDGSEDELDAFRNTMSSSESVSRDTDAAYTHMVTASPTIRRKSTELPATTTITTTATTTTPTTATTVPPTAPTTTTTPPTTTPTTTTTVPPTATTATVTIVPPTPTAPPPLIDRSMKPIARITALASPHTVRKKGHSRSKSAGGFLSAAVTDQQQQQPNTSTNTNTNTNTHTSLNQSVDAGDVPTIELQRMFSDPTGTVSRPAQQEERIRIEIAEMVARNAALKELNTSMQSELSRVKADRLFLEQTLSTIIQAAQ